MSTFAKLALAAVTLLLCWTTALPAQSAQSAKTLAAEALRAYHENRFAQSADLFQQAIASGDEDPGLYYSAACASALAGRADAAFALLDQSVEHGFLNANQLDSDSDFTSLKADARWAPLLEKTRTRAKANDRFWNSSTFATPYREAIGEQERLAGLARFWAEVKFNFANFDLVPNLDWDALYMQYIPQVQQAKTTIEYYRVLSEMCAQLHDGHTNVYPPRELFDKVFARPALRTRKVEGRVMITKVSDPKLEAQGVVPGLEILAIDRVPVMQYAEERIAPYQSASTPQDLDIRTYTFFLLSGAEGTTVALKVKAANGKEFDVDAVRLSGAERAKLAGPTPVFAWKMIGNVAYVELNSFEDNTTADQFLAAFADISKADAIVFDIRQNGGGNSTVGYRILGCLTDKPFKTSRWRSRRYVPTLRAWGQAEGVYDGETEEYGPNGKLLYTKPVAVLTSGATYSAAEDFAVAFDGMKRGAIVGEPTGGSTGQPLFFDLPGGGNARVCSKRDTYPDGKEFVGVGVQPHVRATPKAADIAAGTDAVLEAALREVHTKR